MGVEAGEELEIIVARKEFERRANGGIFLWGVGNSVMPAMAELAYQGDLPQIMFSRMKSPAKRQDRNPCCLFLWLQGETAEGQIIDLPPYSFIMSRGDAKLPMVGRAHYAMYCWSEASISLDNPTGSLCSDEIVNYRSGRSLGASQVTSVVSHTCCCTRCTDSERYEISFGARLLPPGQIRLTNAIPINPKIPSVLRNYIVQGLFDEWRSAVREIKREALNSISARKHGWEPQESWAF